MTIKSISSLPIFQSLTTSFGFIDGASQKAFEIACTKTLEKSLGRWGSTALINSICPGILGGIKRICMIDSIARGTLIGLAARDLYCGADSIRNALLERSWTSGLGKFGIGVTFLATGSAEAYAGIYTPFMPLEISGIIAGLSEILKLY